MSVDSPLSRDCCATCTLHAPVTWAFIRRIRIEIVQDVNWLWNMKASRADKKYQQLKNSFGLAPCFRTILSVNLLVFVGICLMINREAPQYEYGLRINTRM